MNKKLCEVCHIFNRKNQYDADKNNMCYECWVALE